MIKLDPYIYFHGQGVVTYLAVGVIAHVPQRYESSDGSIAARRWYLILSSHYGGNCPSTEKWKKVKQLFINKYNYNRCVLKYSLLI